MCAKLQDEPLHAFGKVCLWWIKDLHGDREEVIDLKGFSLAVKQKLVRQKKTWTLDIERVVLPSKFPCSNTVPQNARSVFDSLHRFTDPINH